MRLMSLLDLSSNESRVPYSLIGDTLQITDEEVEYWVMKAIASKQLDCRRDQLNKVVIVKAGSSVDKITCKMLPDEVCRRGRMDSAAKLRTEMEEEVVVDRRTSLELLHGIQSESLNAC